MARPLWSGSISFGLVSIPVKLTNAVSKKTVSFNQIDDRTGSRIKLKKVSALDGTEVPDGHIVKGYELTKDRYVILQPAELEALEAVGNRSIDIEEFVDLDQIDPVHYERPYYLVPDTGGAKPYALLVQAMKDSGMVAIARMVMRTKQYLVALRAVDDTLVLETLYYSDEVIDPDELEGVPHDIEVSDRELKIARQLIEKKAEGQEIVLQPQTEEPAQVVDLMAALEASLAAVKDAKPAKAAAKKKK